MGRRTYPPEFRAEAVRLVRQDGLSISRVARDLGCARQSVVNWVEQAEIDIGKREGLTTEEREELRRLRRENRVLLQEREILKKAAAWFAKETGSTP
jgi:transposase